MKRKPVQEEHYGATVWVNPTTESLRREECLCLNCGKLKPGKKDNCDKAQRFFRICRIANIALAVTRCATWEPKT